MTVQLKNQRMTEPKNYDVIMGGQTPTLRGSLVLGGIDGLGQQLTSSSEETRCAALFRALQYQDQGKALVIKALHDPSWEVRWTAYRLLMRLQEVNGISEANAGKAEGSQHYPDFKLSESTGVHSLVKNHLKSYLEKELGQYSDAIVGTDFPVRVEPNKDTIADVVAIFPTGYMLAFMVATEPIKPQELNYQSTALFNAGVDVIWWLGEEADTLSNRKWAFQYCDFTYILNIPTCPLIDKREQPELEFNWLDNYTFNFLNDKIKKIDWLLQCRTFDINRDELAEEKASLQQILQIGKSQPRLGQSIFIRAIRQTFHTWRRLNNAQLKRGLLIQNKGLRSFGGVLGSLNNHNHHSRITAIAKMNDGYWQVTDDEQLMTSYLGFPRKLFSPSGVKAMKKRAYAIAEIKAQSQALMAMEVDCGR